MTPFILSPIPVPLEWKIQPLDWKAGPGSHLSILAGKETDWFIDPNGNFSRDNAPCALFVPPDENFILSAHVAVDFASTYDAGVIQIRESETLWAKLCFEYSPQGKPMVVSVVTRGFSDDCNSSIIDGRQVYLRASVTLKTIAFHYSLDGDYWNLVRYFTLGKVENLTVGFSSQSPTGQQCSVDFSEIRYLPGVLKDLRSGE